MLHISLGAQGITIATDTKEFLNAYIHRMLPLVREVNGNNDRLFIGFDGRNVDMGRCYKAFTNKYLGINFSTTSSRALLETSAHAAYLKGVITLEQKESCTQYNGHSGAVAKQYYLQ